jgi:hypothetical protein
MAMTMWIAPARDEIELHMLEKWGLPVIAAIEARTGVTPTRGDASDRRDLEDVLPASGDVYYFGHGTEDGLGMPTLIDRDNVGRIHDMLVAVACDAAERLGPAAIAAGTRAFVGFAGRIPIIVDPAYDALFTVHLPELASDRCTAEAFRIALRSACLELSNRVVTRPRGKQNAHLIAVGADAVRGAVRAWPAG